MILDLGVTACVPISQIWPPILSKPIKAPKLTMKSRKGRFIQHGHIGKRDREIEGLPIWESGRQTDSRV